MPDATQQIICLRYRGETGEFSAFSSTSKKSFFQLLTSGTKRSFFEHSIKSITYSHICPRQIQHPKSV